MDCILKIGGLQYEIRSVRWTESSMPRNFRPFVTGRELTDATDTTDTTDATDFTDFRDDTDATDFTDATGGGNSSGGGVLRVESCGEFPALTGRCLSTSFNDLGEASLYDAGRCWAVALVPEPGDAPRIMTMSKDLRQATVWLREDDPRYDFVMDSMTRIFFSQYAATRRSLMLHASVVELDGKAYVFMGRSGIGKSTHSRLWAETFPGCRLLNDDCPLVVGGADGRFMVSGTPWSGKTPCFRNQMRPVAGIVQLRQAPANRFVPLEGISAFVSFIPGMSVMTPARELYSVATSTALELLDSVTTGILECRPDSEAARVCRHALDGGDQSL